MKDKILICLLDKKENRSPKPTQKEIANEIGESRAYVSRLLKGFEEEGLIKSEKDRVQGYKRKVKIYELTTLGFKKAKSLYDDIIGREVDFGDSENKETVDDLLSQTDKNLLQILMQAEREDEKEKGEEKTETTEQAPEGSEKTELDFETNILSKYGRSLPAISILLIAPLLNVFNFIPLPAYYALGVLGVLLTGYSISSLDFKEKKVKELLSFLIFINLILVMDSILISDLSMNQSYYLIVFSSLLILIFVLPRFLSRDYVRKSMNAVGAILIVLGLGIYLFSFWNSNIKSGIYWLPIGLYLYGSNLRWNFKDDSFDSPLIGIGGALYRCSYVFDITEL